jgi:hypothetical protein
VTFEMFTIEEFAKTMSILENEISRGKSFNSMIVREKILWLTKFYRTAEFEEMLNGGRYARTNKLYRKDK